MCIERRVSRCRFLVNMQTSLGYNFTEFYRPSVQLEKKKRPGNEAIGRNESPSCTPGDNYSYTCTLTACVYLPACM